MTEQLALIQQEIAEIKKNWQSWLVLQIVR